MNVRERNKVDEVGGSNKGKGSKNKMSNENKYFPPASYTLFKAEKQAVYEFLYGIKVLFGYSSNMKRYATLNGELKFRSMKSHDCHVLMQVFLPIPIHGILPNM